MRKLLFCVFLLMTGHIVTAQNTVNRKIAQRYDEYANGGWEGKDSAVFGYNAFGYESNRLLIQGQGATSWNNFLRSTSGYDASGNLSSRQTEIWTNGAWTNSTLYNYTYNASNELLTILYQTWNNGWNNSGRIVNSYNANQSLVKREAFSWNGSWLPTIKDDFTYNAFNELLNKFGYLFQNGVWQKRERLAYQFAFGFVSNLERSVDDGQGGWLPKSRTLSAINGSAIPARIVSEREQSRDTTNNVWLDSLRTIYSYSANLLSQKIKDKYNASTTSWTDIYRYQYGYNTNNLLNEEIYYSTNSNASGLQPDSRKTITYNTNNLIDEIKLYKPAGPTTWSDNGRELFTYNVNDSLTYKRVEEYFNNAYAPSKQYFYYYDNVSVGLSNINNLFKQATLFPNPTSDVINIETTEKISGAMQATIFSYTGKTVWSQLSNKPDQSLNFNIESLPVGQYILQVTELSSGRASKFKFQKN